MGHVAYYRVSTREQGESGLGLDAQRAILCHYLDCDELVAEFTDVASGKDINGRPALQKAIKLCQEGGHWLAVAKVDRLSRRTEDALNIRKRLDARLFCGDLPMSPGDLCDKFMLTLFMAIADRERELIGIRTKAALDAKRQREPDWQPGTPDNLTDAGRARGAAENRRMARRDYRDEIGYIRTMRHELGMSLSGIAKRLNGEGKQTRNGGQFYPMTVKRILERAREQP